MRERALAMADAAAVSKFVAGIRQGAEAYPGPDDVPVRMAGCELAGDSRGWFDAGGLVAWCLVEPTWGNILFDIRADVRTVELEDRVVGFGLGRLPEHARTPVDDEDRWRADLVRRVGFRPDRDVVHLVRSGVPPRDVAVPPPGWLLRPLDEREDDRYVELHREVFGTDFMTRQLRSAWREEPGYAPDLDLVLVEPDDAFAGMSISWAPGASAHVGVIGVRPDLRGRGLSRLLVGAAVERLADRGVTEMTLTTDVPAMLATATSTGFTEHRRTHWLTRPG